MRFQPVIQGLLFLLPLCAVHAKPLKRDTGKATLKIAASVNATGVNNIAANDRARLQYLSSASSSADNKSVSISNVAIEYTVEVGVGTPPTYYSLLIDTGSSTTWVGANPNNPYIPTSSSVNTNNSVYVVYGSGEFYGEEWLDNVTLTSDLVVSQQSIGAASSSLGEFGLDGMLGLGPKDLTLKTVENTFEVQTVPDNLYTQKKIPEEVVGIFFAPFSETDNSGTLTFGGYDNSVMTNSVNYVPLTTAPDAAYYWGINQSISYGNTTIMASTSGIVDTGTTLIMLATDAYQQYMSLTGATLDPTTGLLMITSTQYANLQTLWFNISSTSYGLTPNGQIWPRSLNTAIGGSSSAVYLIITDMNSSSAIPGINFVNGYTFLQRFYSVFDTTNHRFGIAETIYTNSTTN